MWDPQVEQVDRFFDAGSGTVDLTYLLLSFRTPWSLNYDQPIWSWLIGNYSFTWLNIDRVSPRNQHLRMQLGFVGVATHSPIPVGLYSSGLNAILTFSLHSRLLQPSERIPHGRLIRAKQISGVEKDIFYVTFIARIYILRFRLVIRNVNTINNQKKGRQNCEGHNTSSW